MAKKSDLKLLGLVAFIAMILAATCWLLQALGVGDTGLLSLIATLGFLVVVLWVAWYYVKTQKDIWRLLYLIIFVLVIIAFVLGNRSILLNV